MRRTRWIALLAVALAPFGRGTCGEPAAPLYTNQDLERFGPPTTRSDRPATVDPEGWAPVVEFLDREYARIDADRRHELERRDSDRQDRVVDSALPDRDSYLYGWVPYGGTWPYGWGGSIWTDYRGYGYGYADRRHVGGGVRHPGAGGPGLPPERLASTHAATAHVNAQRHRAFLDRRPTLNQPGRHPLAPAPGGSRGRR